MLENTIKIKSTPTNEGVMIEETLNDMRISLAEYRIEAVDKVILESMSDEMLLNLFYKVQQEKNKRGL